jgi:hypothetical protein
MTAGTVQVVLLPAVVDLLGDRVQRSSMVLIPQWGNRSSLRCRGARGIGRRGARCVGRWGARAAGIAWSRLDWRGRLGWGQACSSAGIGRRGRGGWRPGSSWLAGGRLGSHGPGRVRPWCCGIGCRPAAAVGRGTGGSIAYDRTSGIAGWRPAGVSCRGGTRPLFATTPDDPDNKENASDWRIKPPDHKKCTLSWCMSALPATLSKDCGSRLRAR